MLTMRTAILMATIASVALISCFNSAYADTYFFGPTPYLQQSNSPYASYEFQYFYLEDFEDGALNSPGLSVNYGAIQTSDQFTDSVDADDGAIDGNGRLGHSWYASFGQSVPADITFSFNKDLIGKLPTHVGFVWTDSAGNGGYPAPTNVSFEVFGPSGASLGIIGPYVLGDHSSTGQTAEDRFLGASNPDGISAMRIFQSLRQIEVDHVQYGYMIPIPVPAIFEIGFLIAIVLLLSLGVRSIHSRFKEA